MKNKPNIKFSYVEDLAFAVPIPGTLVGDGLIKQRLQLAVVQIRHIVRRVRILRKQQVN